MVRHEFPDYWEGKDDLSENSDDESWSMDVNLDNENLLSKSGGSFQSFVDWVTAMLGVWKKLRFCVYSSVQALRTMCGHC